MICLVALPHRVECERSRAQSFHILTGPGETCGGSWDPDWPRHTHRHHCYRYCWPQAARPQKYGCLVCLGMMICPVRVSAAVVEAGQEDPRLKVTRWRPRPVGHLWWPPMKGVASDRLRRLPKEAETGLDESDPSRTCTHNWYTSTLCNSSFVLLPHMHS